MKAGLRRYFLMSKSIQKQECLVVCYCTLQETKVANVTYSVQGVNSLMKDQITLEVGWFLKTGERLSQNWRLIQDNTIPREKLHGQHLEVVTSEGNLSIPWVTLTPPLNGHTTETSITALQGDKQITASIKYLYDFSTTNQETPSV